jgi:hypothetical protein
MKKHNGPLSKMDIVTVAWAHKIHPTFTSHDNLRQQVFHACHPNLGSLPKYNDKQPDKGMPDIFLSSGRLNRNCNDSTIHSNVLLIQAERSQVKTVRLLLKVLFAKVICLNTSRYLSNTITLNFLDQCYPSRTNTLTTIAM